MLYLARKLLPYLAPYRLRFGWALLQVFLIAGFNLLKPWPLQLVIDHVLERDTGLVALRTYTVTIPKAAHRALVVEYGAGG